MFARLLTAAALTAITLCAAHAQSSSSSMPSNSTAAQSPPSTSGQPSVQTVPSEIRQKLSEDGYKNIQIVPGSFLVSAKDKRGDPVTMVIGPNSMMLFTQVPNSRSGGTSGSNSASTSSGSATGSSVK
jgi:hypothetical protein